MAKLYARKCEQDGLNFYKVPAKWADATRQIIEDDGYIIQKDGTVVEA